MVAPIVLFVYNRPLHTQRTVESLQRNDLAVDSDLYIFSDGPKDNTTDLQRNEINKVRQYIHTISGFRNVTICESATNKGLAHSVIDGVTSVIKKYGKVIVVEDDLELNPYFLRYMNDALSFYEEYKHIFMIGGYNYPIDIPSNYQYDIYVSYRCESWGWATWKDRWNKADWNIENYKIIQHPNKCLIHKFNRGGADLYNMLLDQYHHKIDSWAIRWQNCLFENDGLCISPIKTFVQNLGFDGTGVHCGNVTEIPTTAPLFDKNCCQMNFESEIKVNSSIQKALFVYFKPNTKSWWLSIIQKVLFLLKR